jgi:hypothetical protein
MGRFPILSGQVVLPDVIPAKAGSLNRAVIYHWPQKEGILCPVPKFGGTCFCCPGTNFIEHYTCRAVTRTAGRGCKFDQSHDFIPGYKVGGGHWRSHLPAERSL